MTVKELIEKLQKLPPDPEVVVSIDEEGNGFKPIGDIQADMLYQPRWGEVRMKGEIDTSSDKEWRPAVILWTVG